MRPRFDLARLGPRARLAALVLTALAARCATFGNPVVQVDEDFYLTVAKGMLGGGLPYVDLWDRKPIGLFLLYLPPALLPLPAALWAYQLLAAAFAVATAWLLARIADRVGWSAGALPAAMLYLLLLDLADGQGGQSPVFYNLPMAAAALLALPRAGEADGARRRRGLLAMALVGLALQIKYSVVFEGFALGLWLGWRDWRAGRSAAATLGYMAALAGVALAPTALAFAAYAAAGHAEAWLFANFTSILSRGADPSWAAADNLSAALQILGPSALLAAIGLLLAPSRDHGAARRFVLGWLAAALLGFAVFGSWYNHYTLPVMAPLAVATAAFFARFAARRWLVAVPLLLLFLAGQRLLVLEEGRRGTPAEFAAMAKAVGHGPGGLFILSGPVLLYPATGRPALTRYLFPTHLSYRRENGAIGVGQADELRRVFARRPAVVVRGRWTADERAPMFRLVDRLLAAGGYRADAPLPLGREPYWVFRRTEGEPVRTPPSRPAAR